MTKLHEILAVEPDLEGTAKKVTKEGEKTFEKGALFIGFEKSWEMFAEERSKEAPPPERQNMETTVHDKLAYVCGHLARYYDSVLTKEFANQTAWADLVVDGEVLISDAPATFLLGMENKLKALRAMYERIPTLAMGFEWSKAEDLGEHVYRQVNPEVKFKTAKTFRHQILVQAMFPSEGQGGTSLPAQVEKWEETENVGMSTKSTWCGMISSAQKSAILHRLDNLIQACKGARQRANDIQVSKINVCKALFAYING